MIRPDRPLAETLEPRLLLATFTVTNNLDTGAGSLRQVITSANATPAADVIQFNLPGTTAAARTIRPGTPLPVITAPLAVDGTTQPGYAVGAPVVRLSGNTVGLSFRNAIDVAVRGLSITNCNTAIRVVGGQSAVIEGNWIGIAPDGSAAGNTTGISLVGAAGARVGGTTAAARNVISANTTGVRLGADNADSLPTRGAVVAGNYIGPNPAGLALNSTLSRQQAGVLLARGAEGNVIGGTDPGARNLISGNASGVETDSSGSPLSQPPPTSNRIQGNWIGLDVAGNALSNSYGIQIRPGSNDNLIGGTAPGARNVISGNTNHGVIISAARNRVEGNWIGVDAATGAVAIRAGLGAVGILIGGGGSNIIGGAAAGAGNVISGNVNMALYISSPNNRVLGNYIGINAAGDAAVRGSGIGVLVTDDGDTDVSGNEIGGAAPGEGNVISGNTTAVWLRGPGSGGTKIAGNLIGLNAAGTAKVGNSSEGILLASSGNVVGLATPDAPAGARNVISGNYSGVRSQGNNNIIRGNYVGTNAAGTAVVGNTNYGLAVDPEPGPTPPLVGNVIDRNVVSGNNDGVSVLDAGGSSRVVGNLVGTDFTGTRALPNNRGGMFFYYSANLEILDNVVSGNGGDGIGFLAPPKAGTLSGNRIGVAAAPADPANPGDPPAAPAPLGNGGHGIWIGNPQLAATDRITIADNIIAHNAGAGIYVFRGRHAFWNNSIYSNGGLGIDLEPLGVNPNDGRLDASKPNTGLDFPVITAVYPSGDKTVVLATLSGVLVGDQVFVTLYLSPAADPSGFGEGAERLAVASAVETRDLDGRRRFAVTLDRVLPAGQYLTATATRTSTTAAETSEFSAAVPVPAPDASLPRVAGVYAGGPFADVVYRRLESGGLGAYPLGYKIPSGAAQLDTLPWSNAARIKVAFTEPVNIHADDLVVRGASGVVYPAHFEAYEPYTLSGFWVLPESLPEAERLTLELDANPATGVTDFAGNALDGEWANGADAYPSGDGAAGGDFRFSIKLLQGDADRRGGRVNALDLAEVRRRLNSTTTTDVGPGYSLFADLDGSGSINSLDLAIVRRNLNRFLPAVQAPPAALFGPRRDDPASGITAAVLSA